MPKILGLDYGTKRLGIAISSEDGRYAFAYSMINQEEKKIDILKLLKDICQQEDIIKIVIGLPLNQYGEEGKEALAVKKFGDTLRRKLSLPVIYEDERFTSALATTQFKEAGRSVKNYRQHIDQKSAQIILQTYLDRRHGALSSD